jgi:alpha-L-glutamate ligase-like protein
MIYFLKRFTAAGVLGLNMRNGDYIMRYNPRRLYPLVDDKLLTKEYALAAGIAVPQLYGTIKTQHDIRDLDRIVGEHQQFALKPSHGSGGDGIFVIAGRSGEKFRTVGGTLLDRDVLEHHLSNAINGQFSLGGVPDAVIVEYMVKFSQLFERISFQGVPDIRVIVYRGVPVMAMVRLPTRQSHGKANLHQGAVGVGIDVATGRTLGGVVRGEVVTHHPDTANPVEGVQIPDWDVILEIAARSHDITGLGYIGVDVVLDRDLGPLVLELNARPGLAIQIANRQGLLRRLRFCDACADFGATTAERIEFARQHFAHPVGPLLAPADVAAATAA